MTKNLTVKETAAAIRKHLRATFPDTKFSIRMSRGTGYGWLDASWTNGPAAETVSLELYQFQDRTFSALEDGYQGKDSTGELDGEQVRYSCCGVITHRELNGAALYWAREQTSHRGDVKAGDVVRRPFDNHSSVVAPWDMAEREALALWLRQQSLPF